ncbi:MAG: topology modulation protein FlaR [Herbinix sp.]|jgi:adenylate kinase family enzyme|nr:topology modulation protein FlaR [Herbinix sp.]
MRIYIVGAVSSGKTTLAKSLSKKLHLPYHSLDEMVHISDQNADLGNRKRPIDERDSLFQSTICQPAWIIEDVGRPCFEEGLKEAETILLLETSTRIRNYRIIKRWLKQRLGLEYCIYTPSITILKCMLRWSKEYDLGKDNLKERISTYQDKIIILRDQYDIQGYLDSL